jgi:hypothetical protein
MLGVYFPLFLLLRRLLGGCRPILVFPIAGSLVFLIPTALVMWMSSTNASTFVSGLASAEALLFYLLFFVVGFTGGVGFVWSCREAPERNRNF